MARSALAATYKIGDHMKFIITIIFFFIFLNCNSYEWTEIGDFNEPVWKYYNDENNNFQVVGVEEGLYLNTDENWEYCHRGFRVFDIADLDSTNLLLADADGWLHMHIV